MSNWSFFHCTRQVQVCGFPSRSQEQIDDPLLHTISSCFTQLLKLQESPDAVPKGELPRHIQLYCDRYLTDKVVPGNRITVIGIYSIRKGGIKPQKVHQKENSPELMLLPFSLQSSISLSLSLSLSSEWSWQGYQCRSTSSLPSCGGIWGWLWGSWSGQWCSPNPIRGGGATAACLTARHIWDRRQIHSSFHIWQSR